MSETFEIYLTGKVDSSGRLMGMNWTEFNSQLDYFKDKAVELILRKKKKYRSIQQNKLMWVYYTMIAHELGYTKDEIHSILKSKFLKSEKVNEETGVIYPYVKSTTDLTTTEMLDYISDIQKFAAEELGMNLPEPNEQFQLI